MAQSNLRLVSTSDRDPDPFGALTRAPVQEHPLPTRSASAAFGFSIGVAAILSGLFVAVLPGIARVETFACLVGAMLAALGFYQWHEPAPRSVWDVRVGGAMMGAGASLSLVTAAILLSPLFEAAGSSARAWAASMPGFAALLFTFTGWMLVRPRD